MGGFSIGRVDREIDVLADGRQVQLRVGDGAAVRVVKALAQLGLPWTTIRWAGLQPIRTWLPSNVSSVISGPVVA